MVCTLFVCRLTRADHHQIGAKLRDKHKLKLEDEQVRSRLRQEKAWYTSWLQKKASKKAEEPEEAEAEVEEAELQGGAKKEPLKQEEQIDAITGTHSIITTYLLRTLDFSINVLPFMCGAEKPTIVVDNSYCYILFTKTARRDVFMEVQSDSLYHCFSNISIVDKLPRKASRVSSYYPLCIAQT